VTLQVSCVQLHWAKPLSFNLQRTLHYISAAADAGSRVVLFPEAELTSYYFPYVIGLDPAEVQAALDLRWRRARRIISSHRCCEMLRSVKRS
jgi:predicted amidohydrolase